uniref:Uncharacterized protein n=1 Tax=Cacopsylla melanoneura TaxID=428564 RepID=A0A8D9E5P1_9HEMI
MTICKSFNEGYSLADWVRIYPLNKAPKPQISPELFPTSRPQVRLPFTHRPPLRRDIRSPFPIEKTPQLAVDGPGQGHLPIHVVSTPEYRPLDIKTPFIN